MSEFGGEDANDEGLFEYDGFIVLDDYWTDDKRHPFIVSVGGKLAGFAVMREEEFDDGERQVGVWHLCRLGRIRA